jgi:hypothetical protein
MLIGCMQVNGPVFMCYEKIYAYMKIVHNSLF